MVGADTELDRQVLELIKDPIVRLVLLMGLFILFYNHGMNHWLPDLLRSYGMTPTEAGYWAAIPTLFGMIASLSLPRMATPEWRFKILFGLFFCAAIAAVLVWAASGPLTWTGSDPSTARPCGARARCRPAC